MKKIFKIVLILITLIISANSGAKANALTSDNSINPRYLEGTATFYNHTLLTAGGCSGEATAYVTVGYYQTAAQGAYIKIIGIDMAVDTDGHVDEVTSVSSSPSVGSNIQSGQTVYVSQRIKCSNHGEQNIRIAVPII